jgi:hypothetical protein
MIIVYRAINRNAPRDEVVGQFNDADEACVWAVSQVKINGGSYSVTQDGRVLAQFGA